MNMTSTSDGTLGSAIEARPAPAGGAVPSGSGDGSAPPQADEGAHTDPRAGTTGHRRPFCNAAPCGRGSVAPAAKMAAVGGGRGRPGGQDISLVPTVETALNTVSTDDAYVNGHVTLVCAPVPGQVARVLVNDNNRVKKGHLLVQLDREPYQVLVDIKRAAVVSAEARPRPAAPRIPPGTDRYDHRIRPTRKGTPTWQALMMRPRRR